MRSLAIASLLFLASSCTQPIPRPVITKSAEPSGATRDDSANSIPSGNGNGTSNGSGMTMPNPATGNGEIPNGGSGVPDDEPITMASGGKIPAIDLPHDTKALALLDSFKTSATTKILYGQLEDDSADPSAWSRFIRVTTNRTPSILALSLRSTKDAANWTATSQKVLELSKKNVIPSLTWEPCSPAASSPCDEAKAGALTTAQWKEMLGSGNALSANLQKSLDQLATQLAPLKDVPLILTPFPRLDDAKNWWGGRQGDGGSAYLYEFARYYLVSTKGFKNLIFVMNITGTNGELGTIKPPDDTWDITSLSLSGSETITDAYADKLGAISPGKIIAASELGTLPNATQLKTAGQWAFIIGQGDRITKQHSRKVIKAFFANKVIGTLSASVK